MGYAARANLRSPEGGKPKALNALHRSWRAVQYFGDDRAAFDRWLDGRNLSVPQRAAMDLLWDKQHPVMLTGPTPTQPMVTLETAMPR